jgi:hypothetical protein
MPASVAAISCGAYIAVKRPIEMARRFITSLLTIAYFVGQLGLPPHAHGSSRENQPSDHDARPHFHLSCTTHGDHSHDADHDSDAIYLPNGAELSLPAKSVAAPVCLNLVSNLAIATMATPPVSFHASTEANSPDKCSSHCALYLALRALRI